MRNSDHDPLKHIEALPDPARKDLIAFIEASSGLPGKSELDETEYLEAILALGRRDKLAG